MDSLFGGRPIYRVPRRIRVSQPPLTPEEKAALWQRIAEYLAQHRA